MQKFKKFATKKEAKEFCATLLPIQTHIYKGHRGVVVQWEAEVSSPLNADGKPSMSVEELHKRIIELNLDGRKIPAVKLVRIELGCGLSEALDYCNKIWNA